jgi:Flp pilus assembly protein TadG
MLKKNFQKTSGNERGGTLLEFTFVASGFFMMLVGIVACGNLYYTHNALVEATRRAARYAVMHPTGSTTAVQNVAVYGTDSPGTGATSAIYNLQTTNVTVTYSSLNIASGSVTVKIVNYSFPFVLPITTTSITMPAYSTTLTGESAGLTPPDI